MVSQSNVGLQFSYNNLALARSSWSYHCSIGVLAWDNAKAMNRTENHVE